MPGSPGQEEAEKGQLGEFLLERKTEQSRHVTSVDFLPHVERFLPHVEVSYGNHYHMLKPVLVIGAGED